MGGGFMERNRLIIDAVYTSWEAGDLRSMLSCFSEAVAFAVHPPSSTSYVGQGRGKALLHRRLARFMSEVQVVDYETSSVILRAGWFDCRVCYHYRHRKTGMEIDGTQRHQWRVVRGKVVHLDIIHDTRRFGAFLDLAARTAAVQ
jgi:ketosteroid isomerase-like protein